MEYDEKEIEKIKKKFIKSLEKRGKKPTCFSVSKRQYFNVVKARKAGVKMTVPYNGGETVIPIRMVQ